MSTHVVLCPFTGKLVIPPKFLHPDFQHCRPAIIRTMIQTAGRDSREYTHVPQPEKANTHE